MRSLALAAVMVLGAGQLYAGWGATPVKEKYRPKTNWLNSFSDSPDIIADGSINSAVEQCDDIVGKGKYCVVGIPGRVLNEHVEIFRSKTKLVGTDKIPLRAGKSGTMFYIGDNTRYVVIEDLKIEGTDVGNRSLFGIIVEGKSINHVVIRNNEIYNFSTGNGDAHAIALYGTGEKASQAIRNILISGNTIHDMRTGSSESIAVNGNVARWQISNNDIYDINNIAIDIIGGEGTAPTRSKNGRTFPGKYDVARYGFVEDNFVENMHTSDNPAYDNEESWAAAVYIDGAHHVEIHNNVIENTAWAYEIGAENCMKTRHITMSGNSAQNSYFGDLVVGGYNTRGYLADRSIECDPAATGDSDEGHGYVRYISIYENDLLSTSTQEEDILIQYRTTHAIIEQEGVDPVNDNDNGSARGDENAIRTHR
jgi:hypothetical protein